MGELISSKQCMLLIILVNMIPDRGIITNLPFEGAESTSFWENLKTGH